MGEKIFWLSIFSARTDRLKEGPIRHGWSGWSAWLVRVDLVDCAELSSLALSKLSLARLWIQGVVHMLGITRNEG